MLVGIVLAALVLAAAVPSRAGAGLLAALSLLWLLVNEPMQGSVLLAVTRDNGLTSGDLAGLAGLALALLRFAVPVWRARGQARADRAPGDEPSRLG